MATKTTDKQQIHVVTDANFNHNKLINAKIDAKENEITNLPSGGNVDDVKVNNTSVVENKIASINLKTINRQSIVGSGNIDVEGGGSNLNEFVITQEIFDEYKNENDYADLADIIDSEEITQKVINLNNFNFFLNNLTISNKDLIFKNGNIILDSNGVDGTCDKAITASNCELFFKDCTLSAIDCENPINAVIDLNNSNLLFDNVIADNINFSESKSFIQTTGRCEVNIKESNIELLNNDESEDEPENILTFIKVLTDDTLIKLTDSMVKIDKPIDSNLNYFEHKMISTATNVDAEIKIINSYLEIEDTWDPPHSIKEHELSNIFDINLDNTDIDIINSCINNQSVLRLESKYMFEQGNTYTTDDPYCINIYNDIEIREHSTEDEEHIFEEINIDKDTFLSIVDYQEGEYIFIYDGTNWILNDETVNPEDYGITYTLIDGAELYDGVEIQVYYDKRYEAYDILKDFTANDDIENYTKIIKDTIIDDTVPGIKFIRVENEEDYINTINDILEENDYPTDDTYYEEYTYNNDEWHLKLYRIVSETEDVVIENEVVDLNEFGGAIQIGLNDETPDLVNGMKFTVVSQTPYLEKRGLHINKCYNSVIAQDTVPGYKFSEYFINNHTIGETSVFSVHKVMSESISTDEISADSLSINEEGDYFLPIHNENLESDNVKDAINELADRESSANNLFDIKTISEPIIQKGWSCISYPTQNKLDKADVPTAYDFLKDRLDNADITISNWQSLYFNNSIRSFIVDNNLLIFNRSNNNLYKCEIGNISDSSTWTQINLSSRVGFDPNNEDNYKMLITDKIVCFYLSEYNTNYNLLIILNRQTLEEVKIINNSTGSSPQYISLVKDYVYYTINNNTYRFLNTTVANDINPELLVSEQDIRLVFKFDGTYYYYIRREGGYPRKWWVNKTVDFSTIIPIGRLSGYGPDAYKCNFTYDNNGNLYNLLPNGQIRKSKNIETWSGYGTESWEDTTLDFTNYGSSYQASSDIANIFKNQNGFIIEYTLQDTGYCSLLYTTDMINFQSIKNKVSNNDIYFTDTNGNYANYGGYTLYFSDPIAVKTDYTDTINGIDIKYYKNGDWKICTPDIAVGNDDNLQDVFEFLGYLNYWWIDTANEQITLQRNSNMWTMMYVGDDYEDDSLPSGNATRLLPQKNYIEDTTKTNVLFDEDNIIQPNTDYVFGSLTSLEFDTDSYNKNQLETTIQFTAGTGFTFTDNSGITWVDGTPTFTIGKTYLVLIVNNLTFIREW